MKKFIDGFDTKSDSSHISVASDDGIVMLGIDIGCAGMNVELNKEEANNLIAMLKMAIKKI